MIGGVDLTREEAVHRYLHLVKYVAGRVSVTLPPHVELSDLFNDGVLGLIDAIEKYDDARGVKFETYKLLEGKKTSVVGWHDEAAARRVILESFERFGSTPGQ